LVIDKRHLTSPYTIALLAISGYTIKFDKESRLLIVEGSVEYLIESKTITLSILMLELSISECVYCGGQLQESIFGWA
jgi:hypothetical protein